MQLRCSLPPHTHHTTHTHHTLHTLHTHHTHHTPHTQHTQHTPHAPHTTHTTHTTSLAVLSARGRRCSLTSHSPPGVYIRWQGALQRDRRAAVRLFFLERHLPVGRNGDFDITFAPVLPARQRQRHRLRAPVWVLYCVARYFVLIGTDYVYRNRGCRPSPRWSSCRCSCTATSTTL